jgi:CheY-like chemotaxis protein/sugar-specific transcriptional regulator TrmB
MSELVKILIVDDEAGVRESLQDMLAQEGYKTKTAATGKEAIDACKNETFDCAIVDVKLPDVDGTALLDNLKKLNPTLARIIITGNPSLETAVQSINTGFDGYIVKPFNPQKLINHIKERIESRQKEKWEGLLQRIGLSSNEAKIFLSLILGGPSEAGKLGVSTGVPRTKTYISLRKLVQMGLIQEIPGDPQRFSTSVSSNALISFVESWKDDLREQSSTLVDLEKAITSLGVLQDKREASGGNIRKETVWLIQGDKEIARVTGELLSKAKVSVCVVTIQKGLVLFYKNFGKVLDELAERGVKIHIKVPIGSSDTRFVHELRFGWQVANMPVAVPVFLMIVDKNKLLMSNLRTDDQETSSDKEFGVVSQDGTLSSYIFALLCFDK